MPRGLRTNRLWVATGLTVLVVSGCSEDAVGPRDQMAPETAEAVAMFLVDVDGTAGWSGSVAADGLTGTREFSRSADCPAGGTRSVAGSGTASVDQETRILSTTWSTTLTHDECAFAHSRRDETVTLVIDGSVTASGSATYQLPDDRRRPRKLLSYNASRVGSTTTTVGDRIRTCEVNVQEVYDPDTATFEVTGTVCGRTVNVTRTPGGRRDG